MFLTAIAMLVVGQATPMSCPVMGNPLHGEGGEKLTYKGAEYTTCCAGCGAKFQAEPEKYLKTQAKEGHVVGTFLFDPTTGLRIESKNAKASSDFGGLRYYFASESSKKTFDANPKKFVVTPAKEALFCPVSKEAVKDYAAASGYGDYKGVRFFFCCGGCEKPFSENPAKYAPNAAKAVHAPKVVMQTSEKMADMAFNCKHCGRKMTVKAGEMAEKCSVCKCGQANSACKPAGTK